jgi:ribosomal protein S18 acetylase RimI-like enzyme
VASWIEPLATALASAEPFRGLALLPAARADEERLFELHREAMREYVATTWGWDEGWQRAYFAETYAPARNALIVRDAATSAPNGELVGRICLTRRWRRVFLRDIEIVAAERNRGLGTAILAAVLELARSRRGFVELLVLKCNPAQRLYARLGFAVVGDDGARFTMRA